MQISGISLGWSKCPDGVAVREPAIRPLGEDGVLIGDVTERQFVYKSEAREGRQFTVDKLSSTVSMIYINLPGEEGLLNFFSCHGFLSNVDGAAGVSIEGQLATQRSFTKLAEDALHPDQERASNALGNLLDKAKVGPFAYFPEGSKTLRLTFFASNLLTYMRMEIAYAASVGARFARCEHCNKAFLTGPMTSGRSHAKYCRDYCRVSAMRKRNKLKETT